MEEQKPAIAIIQGQAVTTLPNDLYIPPDALQVFLEAFEGPLDLLLYLIKKQNIDILNIPIAEITRQYINYVELMQEFNLELAADYLVMAAFLAEVKSRLLLPKPVSTEADDVDPRAELIRKLQEYERYKKAAEDIDQLPRIERDILLVQAALPEVNEEKRFPQLNVNDVLMALADLLKRVKLHTHHQVQLETLSIKERMIEILTKLHAKKNHEFSSLFPRNEGRLGVVVTFIAVLELIRQSLIEVIQTYPYAPIYICAVANAN